MSTAMFNQNLTLREQVVKAIEIGFVPLPCYVIEHDAHTEVFVHGRKDPITVAVNGKVRVPKSWTNRRRIAAGIDMDVWAIRSANRDSGRAALEGPRTPGQRCRRWWSRRP